MKRSMWARLLAVLLVFSMLPVNASAAMWDNWFNRKPQSSQSSTQKPGKAEKEAAKAEKEAAKAEKEAGKKENKPGKTEKPQTPAKPGKTEKPQTPAKPEKPEKPQAPVKPEKPQKPGQSKPGASEEILVEDVSTAENGQLLRAATFVMKSGTEEAEEEGLTVKYFPVTMYDYNQDTIRDATHKIEVDAGVGNVWNGMYFSGGTPAATTYAPDADVDISFDDDNNALIPDGNYTIYSSGNGKYVLNTVEHSDWNTYTLKATSNPAEATLWTFKKQPDGSYTIQDPAGKYMNIAARNCANLSDEPVYMSIYKDNNGNVLVKKINADNEFCYLNALGGSSYSFFGGWSAGSPVSFEASENGVTLEYASHNFWAKKSGNNANGDLIYTGLVQPEMVDDQIVFNVPEAGIFNDDTAVKTIYEYVGMPFVLKEDGVYSFDSDAHGVYFEGTPQSGTAEAPHNLHFAEGAPQPMPTGLSVGDGSTNAFLPFNNQSSYTTSDVNYHFGMRADLPFSMTPNGRIQSTNDASTPIHFTFSGDDDVWVFIDGHLVIDLGGIHNRLDATIDFAANTVTYSEENRADDNTATGSYNESSFAMIQSLFTMDGVEGIIPQSREAFALDPDHEMQIFYLERGEGTSNARIEFNLPMNDTVIVTKDATKSWSQAGEEADLALNPDDENAGVDPLTDAEQAIVDNIDFGFTLYKKANGAEGFSPVANTNFYLVGRGVDSVIINQTDDKGHFYLKNGQSAKFITEIPQAGVTYYVVEDKVPDGFISPDFTFAGEATYDYSYTGLTYGEHETETSDGKTETKYETYETAGTAPAADASQIPEQIIPMPEKDANGNYVNWPENKSYEVTVSGSIEANDSIEFICSNFLDATLPNPTALAYEDIIVIDYGLPVQIDPLANDVFRGDSIEIIAFGGENMKLGEIVDKDKDKVFEEEELDIILDDDNFHSGSVVLNDVTYGGTGTRDTFTYTMNKQLTEVEVIKYIIKVTGKDTQDAIGADQSQYDYAIGTIYIVPATVMYYEEDFNGMVTFTGSGWTGKVSTAGKSDFQEPGVVGTTNDSIYGSDAAYRSDSFDSNGTSYHGDTSNGAIRFTYTFTGTGTTIFARTSATTGYVQIKVYEGEGTSGKLINLTYRDTYYKDENGLDTDAGGTLYNIPIFTDEFLDYGTYTVVATVAKAGTPTANTTVGEDGKEKALGSGKDFYLDGIRVKQPLNEHVLSYDNEGNPDYDDITDKALGAYATDGESNLDTITLRQKLITDHEQKPDTDAGETETEWPFAVLTDIDGGIVYASDYVSIGPKEEVYLNPGQSVSFAIKSWHKDGYRMHMGMKAPFGNATVKVGQTTFNLENAADCYYDITDMQNSVIQEEDGSYTATYTFTATDKIVSLTNIKITGNYEFALVESPNIDVEGGEGEDPAGYLLEKPDEEVTEEETEEETEDPEAEDTETEDPEAEDTVTETPEVEDTMTETPEAEDTVTETPEVEETETETPEVENTETVTPDIEAASTENTDAAAADVGETDVEA